MSNKNSGMAAYTDSICLTSKEDEMLKIRLQGTTQDIKWFLKILKKDNRFIMNKGQGNKTYVKVSGNKKIKINKKTGKITVKKGLKKGTYKVKVKIKAAGNKNFKSSGCKQETFNIMVK